MEFQWDSIKADINLKKHGISFTEAQTVFHDPLACIFDDEWNSLGEQRELIIGYSNKKRLLIVSFTERLPDTIRLISARQSTARERKEYENYRRH
jgi:uncharacterized DUF497 family protein